MSRTDTERLDWLAANPIGAEVEGGADDGQEGVFWGIGAYKSKASLRDVIDIILDAKAKGEKIGHDGIIRINKTDGSRGM